MTTVEVWFGDVSSTQLVKAFDCDCGVKFNRNSECVHNTECRGQSLDLSDGIPIARYICKKPRGDTK